jgi:hypothetical protein
MEEDNDDNDINFTIYGTIYPSWHFLFGAAFVCQAGNFKHLDPTTYITSYQCMQFIVVSFILLLYIDMLVMLTKVGQKIHVKHLGCTMYIISYQCPQFFIVSFTVIVH